MIAIQPIQPMQKAALLTVKSSEATGVPLLLFKVGNKVVYRGSDSSDLLNAVHKWDLENNYAKSNNKQ